MNNRVLQCNQCKQKKENDLLHCECFKGEEKNEYIIRAERECPYFKSTNEISFNTFNYEQKKVLGGVFGFVIGDMLGVPVEFSAREERNRDLVKELRAYGTYHQPFGAWSDDSSLMLALLSALVEGFTYEKLADNFADYYLNARFTPFGEMFDIGIATKNAINNYIRGIPPIACGGTSEYDNGNGSLMRILPFAFMKKMDDEELWIEMIENVSALTHGHKRSKLACIFYCYMVSCLYEGADKTEALEKTIHFVKKRCKRKYKEEFNVYSRILDKSIIELSKNEIKSTGYVVDTFEAVIWLFFNEESYKETVLAAVNLGGDTDTIAAIVGGMAGVYYGINEIPENWIQTTAKKEEILKLVVEFQKMFCIEKGFDIV